MDRRQVGVAWCWRRQGVVQRTQHARASIENVRIDHCRVHMRVAEELLDRSDVLAALQQVRRKRMAPMPMSE